MEPRVHFESEGTQGVCLERVMFLKSRRFSGCFFLPGIGSGEPLGMVPCLCRGAQHRAAASFAGGCGAARVSPVQLQQCGAALPCSRRPLPCARCRAFVAFARVLSRRLCRRDGNVC